MMTFDVTRNASDIRTATMSYFLWDIVSIYQLQKCKISQSMIYVAMIDNTDNKHTEIMSVTCLHIYTNEHY